MTYETNSTLIRTSRYVSGGITEVGQTTLEWWERQIFVSAADDLSYVVEKKFEGRLDLIAAMFLGEPRYWWLIAMYNNILDPFNEILEGVVLYIPSQDRVKNALSGKLGGVTSTRELSPTILPIV
jgi:hypothetical protein